MTGFWGKTRTTLEMIKWEHSIFALPFALTATLLAAQGLPAVLAVAPEVHAPDLLLAARVDRHVLTHADPFGIIHWDFSSLVH